jgi:hypothetical protein
MWLIGKFGPERRSLAADPLSGTCGAPADKRHTKKTQMGTAAIRTRKK